MVLLFTGDGKGKTSAALGIALRAAGYGYKSVVVQFMKGRSTGEVKVMDLIEEIELFQFGTQSWVDLETPSDKDRKKAQEAFDFAKKKIEERPFLIILDEINLAVAADLVKLSDLKSLLSRFRNSCHFILTGRNAPESLIEYADLVTEFKEIKHPFQKGIKSVKGLDF